MYAPDAEAAEPQPDVNAEASKSTFCQCCCWCGCCPRTTRGRAACCVTLSFTCTGLVLLLVGIFIGVVGGSAITTLPGEVRADTGPGRNPANGIRETWLPGCGTIGNKTDQEVDECGGGCYNSTFINQINAFYASSDFKNVTFSSRGGPAGQGLVDIQAWYIPPANGTTSDPGRAPRIVVCHGTNQNNQKFESLIAGALLSSAGYGVVLLSLRDHGASGSSVHKLFSWGWDYQYDVLGTWDYAVNDPEGVMGGALTPDKVGLLGFSMGGFTVVNAFGIEAQVPGVWADAPVYSVKDILYLEVQKLIGPLVNLGYEFAWAFANRVVELHYNHPAAVLPGNEVTRKVYLVHNPSDTTVPTSQHDKFVETLGESTTPILQGTFVKDSVCNGDTHRILHLEFPMEYRQKMCTFWSELFGENTTRCSDGSMIPFDR